MTQSQEFATIGGTPSTATVSAGSAIDDPTAFLGRLLHLDEPTVWSRAALSGHSDSGDLVELTFGRLAGAVGAAAEDLATAGVRPGDRVALVADHGPDWVAAFLGILSRGAVAVPLDPNAADLAALLHDADPALVYVGSTVEKRAAVAGTARQALPGCSTPEPLRRSVPRRPEDPAVIVYTSGATGEPKGVVISWANLAYQVGTVARRHGTPRRSTFISILPPHHLFELVVGCLAPLRCGGKIHYPGSLLPADLVAAIADHRGTDLAVVPLFLTALRRRLDAELARTPRVRRATLLAARRAGARLPHAARRALLAPLHARFGGRLRTFYVGGAPLDPELARYFERLGFHVCQGYGMSEASPTISANTPRTNRIGSVGTPLAGTEVRIDPSGEILVRGSGVMLGYWRQPELTRKAIDGDGWLRTGDLGFLDRDGYLFVTGRSKNLIVLANGENVQPEAVESVIQRSDLVGDVCVLSRSGPRGEEIVAVVTPSAQARTALAGAAQRENAIIAEVRRVVAGLAPHQRPSRIVVHEGGLPQTPTRKVRRADLPELLRQHPGSAQIHG